MIRSWFNGQKIAVARGLGRSVCVHALQEYFTHIIKEVEDPYPPNPDLRVDYVSGLTSGLLTPEMVGFARLHLPDKEFSKEYLGSY